MPENRDDRYAHVILDELSTGHSHSQRSLAHSVGIALGLTNLLVRRFIQKGWVRAVQVKPNRIGYLLTPAGLAEKARRSAQAFEDSVRFYAEVKARVRRSLSQTASTHPGPEPPRLIFVGTGEAAEIAYVCLQGTSMRLVGVVQDDTPGEFFGAPILPWTELRDSHLGPQPFDYLVITTFDDRGLLVERLRQTGVPAAATVWL